MRLPVLVALAVALPLVVLASDAGFTQISEPKALKSLLAGRRNVLIVYADTDKALKKLTPALRQAGQEVEGVGSIAVIVCQENKETKKMCKRLDGAELPTGGAVLKHYKSGKYNKDYDRALTAVSIANFLKDPESDAPWSESETAADVQHLDDNSFDTVIGKKKPTLVMFYAPWCGHCKAMKPHFEQAATELKKQKSKVVIAGLDAAGATGRMTGYKFNVTAYPTIKYFENGAFKFDYNGGRTKDDVIAWLKKPIAAAPKQEPEHAAKWSDEPSDVAHLTDETFDPFMEANPSVLVMFYAPWCGHCKAAKPEYVAAAKKMKAEGITGSLAAVDATEFPKLQSRFKVEGFPTFVYFKDGKEAWKPNTGRKEKDFIEYMRNPVEPPPPPPPEAKWSEEPSRVEHLTDESLNKYIKRHRSKHILVMFYAPWCGHCKAFKPDWTETANQLKGTNFVLAALDATEHKKAASEYGVKGFPTIKYFHGGKLAGEYEGPRTSQGLMDFFHSKAGDDEL